MQETVRNWAVSYTKNLLLDVGLYVYTCYNKINKGGNDDVIYLSGDYT
nr:MAG TPA: hypothetical protein [Caudoviricetes sp.]